jgi:hypothetical protein
VVGPPPAPDRIAYYNLWLRGHNDRRSEELLPRLRRVDPYLYLCPNLQPFRGVMYRSWRASRPRSDRLVFTSLMRRYGKLFSTDVSQIAFFDGDIVVDIDDPRYTEREFELLSRPNVRAYVVTGPRAAELYQEAGVTTPVEIVPQGVDVASVTAEHVQAVAAAHRRPDTPVVGYVSSFLLTPAIVAATGPPRTWSTSWSSGTKYMPRFPRRSSGCAAARAAPFASCVRNAPPFAFSDGSPQNSFSPTSRTSTSPSIGAPPTTVPASVL